MGACEERALIQGRIAAAVDEQHRIYRDPALRGEERAGALQRLKDMQRRDEHLLNQHVKQHGCKFERSRDDRRSEQ